MITETGKNLSILICTDYQFIFHWMSFAAWYSVRTNLPDANVAVVCARNPYGVQLYNWIPKAEVKFFMHADVGKKNNLPYLNKIYGTYMALKEELVTQPLVVLDADMMAVRDFSADTLGKLNSASFASNESMMCPPVGPIWYFNRNSLEIFPEIINTMREFRQKGHDEKHLDLQAIHRCLDGIEIADLGNEVHEPNAATFTHYRERCGGFYRKNYEKGVVHPPFNECNALQTPDMSVNEKKVNSLWSKMWIAFDGLNK